jgi:hypothetical protein
MIFYRTFLLDNTRRGRDPGEAARVFVLRDLDEVKNLDVLIPPAASSRSTSQPALQPTDPSRTKT